MASLSMQTDNDWEQIQIPDPNPEGSGLHWANRQFAVHAHLAHGAYVFLLDDDDYLTNKEFVERLKTIAHNNNWPDVIVFRWDHKHHGMMPIQAYWGGEPQPGAIGGSCFAVRTTFFREYAEEFGKKACGDIAFIKALWDEGARFYWHDEVMGEIPVAGGSHGKPEE